MTAPVAGPLSYGQLSVWRDVEGFPPRDRHQANICRVERLTVEMYPDQLVAAFTRVRQRHDVLRTTYELGDGPLRQLVHPPTGEPAPVIEVTVPFGADPDDVADAASAAMTGEAFDLAVEEPWRLAVVVGTGGRITHVILVLHHIAADHWGEDLLENELKAALAGQPPAGPAGSPLELALAQQSDAWRQRRDDTERYLRQVYAAAARTGTPPIPLLDAASVKVNLRSWTGLEGARAAGAAMRTAAPSFSTPSLVLAAYCWTVHRTTGVPDLLVSAMCANRVHAGTPTMVSSMNQWARIVTHHDPGESFDEFALRVHADSLAGYRHGCYDVDLDVRLRREAEEAAGPIGTEIFFNYVQSTASRDDEDRHPPAGGMRVDHVPTAFVGGPAFYLVASQGHRLEFIARTRWAGFGDTDMVDFVTRVHDLLHPAALAVPAA